MLGGSRIPLSYVGVHELERFIMRFYLNFIHPNITAIIAYGIKATASEKNKILTNISVMLLLFVFCVVANFGLFSLGFSLLKTIVRLVLSLKFLV